MSNASKRCPIKGCTFDYQNKDILWSHLFRKHHKSEIISALLSVLGF